jgi:hypothetical protein
MIFIGESKNWIASYTIKFNRDDTFARLLDIKPKNSESIKGVIEYTLYRNGEKQTYGTGEIGNKIGGLGGGNGSKPLMNDKYVININERGEKP